MSVKVGTTADTIRTFVQDLCAAMEPDVICINIYSDCNRATVDVIDMDLLPPGFSWRSHANQGIMWRNGQSMQVL